MDLPYLLVILYYNLNVKRKQKAQLFMSLTGDAVAAGWPTGGGVPAGLTPGEEEDRH